MSYLLPRDEDHDNLGPGELEQHMQRIAGWFRVELPDYHDDRFPGGSFAMQAAVAACPGCGRTVVSAVAHPSSRELGLCGRCAPLSSVGRVDHGEWVRARRGAR